MANSKETKARIKINKLLESSDWRFLDDENGESNIQLEPNIKIKEQDINLLGENYEKTKNGFIDFLLLDDRGFPLVVLEANLFPGLGSGYFFRACKVNGEMTYEDMVLKIAEIGLMRK